MRIISRKTLKDYWEKHPDAEQPLRAWFAEAKKASWSNFNEIKAQYLDARVVGGGAVVFNIKGNTYRLVVRILFKHKKVFIRFIGTHKEYDKIHVKSI